MIYLLILNIGIACLLYFANPAGRLNKYLSCLYFLCAVDVFLKMTRDFLIYNAAFDIILGSVAIRDKIMIILYIISSITYFLIPLFYLIFAIKYSGFEWWNARIKIIVSAAVAITAAAGVLFTEILFPITYYAYNLRQGLILLPFYLWNLAVMVTSNYLMVRSYLKEIKPRLKKEKLIICCFLSPSISIFVITRYIFTLLRIHDTYLSVDTIQLILCLLFFLCFIRYGIMGLKISFEHYNPDRYKETVTSGLSIINHTLKNELTKMSVCLQSIKYYGGANTDIVSNADIINNSLERLNSLVYEINNTRGKLKLGKEFNNVCCMIEKAIQNVRLLMHGKEIEFCSLCGKNLELYCDKVHMSNTIENILVNSIDAIESKGLIKINIEQNRKLTAIVIEDNGCGISEENLKHILNPYFTTKKSRTNFGLGLFYCGNVMEEHGGYIDVQSTEGVGTKVFLYFPASYFKEK